MEDNAFFLSQIANRMVDTSYDSKCCKVLSGFAVFHDQMRSSCVHVYKPGCFDQHNALKTSWSDFGMS